MRGDNTTNILHNLQKSKDHPHKDPVLSHAAANQVQPESSKQETTFAKLDAENLRLWV